MVPMMNFRTRSVALKGYEQMGVCVCVCVCVSVCFLGRVPTGFTRFSKGSMTPKNQQSLLSSRPDLPATYNTWGNPKTP